MNMPTLPGVAPAPKRGPGRPKGSKNKREADLARYVEAKYAGLTPGQQSAAIGLVTQDELRRAGGDLVRAMARKARELAVDLDCPPVAAWALMQKERADLMPYVHQKRPPKAEEDPGDKPTHTYVAIPMDQAETGGAGEGHGEWDTPPDLLENQTLIGSDVEPVTPPSHTEYE
jgi:hypothetical protein